MQDNWWGMVINDHVIDYKTHSCHRLQIRTQVHQSVVALTYL